MADRKIIIRKANREESINLWCYVVLGSDKTKMIIALSKAETKELIIKLTKIMKVRKDGNNGRKDKKA